MGRLLFSFLALIMGFSTFAGADESPKKCERGNRDVVLNCCEQLRPYDRRDFAFPDGSCEKNLVCSTNFGSEGYTCYLLDRPDRQRDRTPEQQYR